MRPPGAVAIRDFVGAEIGVWVAPLNHRRLIRQRCCRDVAVIRVFTLMALCPFGIHRRCHEQPYEPREAEQST